MKATVRDYPDIRVEVCPNVSSINLSKYIDTVDLQTLSWTGYSIDPSTGVVSSIPNAGTFTYRYSIANTCGVTADRKVYLHVAKNKRFFTRDTIAICLEQAEALQINQIFCVEASGVWSTDPVDLMTNPTYIRQSSSALHSGAVVFNGKAAYDDKALKPTTYRGDESAQAIDFIYEVSDGCLAKKYRVVIVLTKKL